MCGINGILRLDPRASAVDRDELIRTRERMATRGPDGAGEWISPAGDVGLGHRRLAIIDLSPAGRQPMSGDGGRFWIVFNGEIYNYRELRRDLASRGVAFSTRSDTEVILALYAREGVGMLSRLRGMYALAIWDDRERSLLLARDPYGIKPLYYSADGSHLRFASQVKALVPSLGGALAVDPRGLVGFLSWGSVPEPLTLWRGVHALPAGHHLVVREGAGLEPRAHDTLERSESPGSVDLAGALEDSIRAHLVADVPVAVFLSAGLDSSLVAAVARRALDEPPVTLTLAFDDYRDTPHDEAPLAAEVARTIGTRHIECRVRREDFLDLWPAALAAMDQPSIDGFNSFVISRVAHQQGIKVVLSGLGGDELMGGYGSFVDVPRWARYGAWLASIPGSRTWWGPLASRMRPDKPKLVGLAAHGASLAGAYFLRRGLFLPEELPALVGSGTARDGLAGYDPVLDAGRPLRSLDGRSAGNAAAAWEAVHRMESALYMRNMLLRDSDWASMAHSLELRVPLVDPRLRAIAAANGYEPARRLGKAEAVRRAAPELPAALWRRPKSGFSIPVARWLEDAPHSAPAGLASRRLALRVLRSFGIDLPTDEAATRPAGRS